MLRSNWCVVIMAAGKGTRMKSDLPKVLHEVAGVPMILRVCRSAANLTDNIIIVVGHQAAEVENTVSTKFNAQFAFQKEQKGTGDAVKTSLGYIGDSVDNVMVLCGDTPLLTKETLAGFALEHEKSDSSVSVLAMELEDPLGYGRLVTDEKKAVCKIVEQSDLDKEESCINLVNSGVYCFKKSFLKQGIQRLEANNAQNEYYITDLISFAAEDLEEKAGYHTITDSEEALGVNSPEELEKASRLVSGRVSVM
ncbi:MAG: sugar phosphate nucleotidyltransferase [Thermodesulfobacteriota bacterium]